MFPWQQNSTSLSVTAPDVIALSLTIIIAMFVAVVGYRAIQRPRIVLTETQDGQWRASRRDVIQYLISIPFLLTAWNFFLLMILLSGDNWLNARQSLIVADSVIIAARILAHVSPERSHELAKSVPLTLVTLLLISGGVRTPKEIVAIFDQWTRADISGPAQAVMYICEFGAAALWYWLGVRYPWQRGFRVPGMPVPPNPRRRSRTTDLP